MQCRMCPNAQESMYYKTWPRYLGSTIACLPHISAWTQKIWTLFLSQDNLHFFVGCMWTFFKKFLCFLLKHATILKMATQFKCGGLWDVPFFWQYYIKGAQANFSNLTLQSNGGKEYFKVDLCRVCNSKFNWQSLYVRCCPWCTADMSYPFIVFSYFAA